MKSYSEAEIKAIATRRWGIQLKRVAGELHGPCPHCRAGRDRFIIWPEGNFWCRVCGEHGFLEDNQKNWKPDAALYQAMQEKRQQEENETAARLRQWQAGFRAGVNFHEAMNEQQRAYWLGEGIPGWAINYYQLGYCASKTFKGEDDEKFTRPAYVIPIKDSNHQQLVNFQYRIVEPPEGAGKYRQESGLPPANFYTRPRLTEGKAIVLEGAKKAIVVLEGIGKAVQVVAWPSMNPHERNIKALESFELIYLVLDPGFVDSNVVERAGRVLGKRLRVVEMPTKPDEAFHLHGMRAGDFRNYLMQGRRV